MKKTDTAPSDGHLPKVSKRKLATGRRSPEGEAEAEADQKWGGKKVKSEPGVEVGAAAEQPADRKPSAIPNGPKTTSAADALRRRRMDSSLAATPRTSTPTRHEDPSVVDCALKVLAEAPLDDDRLVPGAIKTFTEDHVNGHLPAPCGLGSQVLFVAQQLRQRRVDEARTIQVIRRLREAEGVAVASWLSSMITDRDTIQHVCHLLLNNNCTTTRATAEPVRTPQPPGMQASRSIPSPPPSSSRTSQNAPVGFDLRLYVAADYEERRELVIAYFPRAVDLFAYHAEQLIQDSMPPASSFEYISGLWCRLDEEQRSCWVELLSKLHQKAGKSMYEVEARTLIAQQLIQDKAFHTESAQDVESLSASEEGVAGSIEPPLSPKSEPASLEPDSSIVGIPQNQPIQSPTLHTPTTAHLFTRPTLVPYTRPPRAPIFSVILPINTPACPIPDATYGEVRQACVAAYGAQHGGATIKQASPHSWIVSFVGKHPSTHHSFVGRPIKLRDIWFQSEFLARKRPCYFEADFSAALHIPTDDVIREIRWAFASYAQLPQLAEQMDDYGQKSGRVILAWFQQPPRVVSFYVPFVSSSREGGGTFVAHFRPVKTNEKCWVCEVVHGMELCPRAEGLGMGGA